MKKTKKKKSVILRVALLAFSVYLVFTAAKLQFQLVDSLKTRTERQNVKEETAVKVEELKSLLENGTEADFIERAAREKLDYAYSNEQVFVGYQGN